MKRKGTDYSGFFNLRVLLAFLIGGAATCSVLSGALPGFLRPNAISKSRKRILTFPQRVAYQRAIEEVYWRHRIWPAARPDPKPSLNAVMPQAQLEKKVTDYLGKSQALEDHWQRPLTPDELQAEIDRMTSHTKQPEVLCELFEALGNDPLVIAECLARPVLAERLITKLNDRDRVKLTKVAWLTTTLQSRPVRAVTQAPGKVAAIDSTPKAFGVQVNRPYHLPTIAAPSGACTDDTWTPTSITNAPAAREYQTVVWTGSEMIIWGGEVIGGDLTNTGGRYNPSTDSWTATTLNNAPEARQAHTAVWTGSEMIVWGGNHFAFPYYFNTGGRYNPGTDSWTATTTNNAPAARNGHTAVWAGSEMIVWGGNDDSGRFNTGGRYNPGTDSWTATSTTNAPEARDLPTAVWTGSEMIVWGGEDFVGTFFNTGGRYDPSTDSWISTSTNNAPDGRSYHTAVWTGSEMIVWGGTTISKFLNTGGTYDPSSDTWAPTSITGAPAPRYAHTAVWNGVGSSRVDLQACKLEYSIVSPK